MRTLPFVVFGGTCLLAGSLWLLPSPGLTLASAELSLTLGYTVLALLSGGLMHRAGQLAELRGMPWRALALAGVGAIGLPTLLVLLARRQLSTVMEAAAQASVPAIVALVQAGSHDVAGDFLSQLTPALVALGGALLLLPVNLPANTAGWLGLAGYVLSALTLSIASVACYRRMKQFSLLQGFFVISAANAFFGTVIVALLTTISGMPHFGREIGPAAIQALAGACLTAGIVVSIALIAPSAASSRFLFVPVIAAAEAYALMRPTVSTRMMFGASLMFAGGLVVVWRAHSSSEGPLSLR